MANPHPSTPRVLLSPTSNKVTVLDDVQVQAVPEAAFPAAGGVPEAGPPPVYQVVLTGAPCGGKTSSMVRLTDYFTGQGFRVYTVPECATLLWSGGVKVSDLSSDLAVYEFQECMLKLILALEDGFFSLARASGTKSVIFHDRGAMDARAYMSSSLWQAMLDENGWTNTMLRDKRYAVVVHLVTAAIGAEEYYQYGPGTPRMETPDVARALDRKIRHAWLGHPYLVIVDNKEVSFEAKIDRVVDVVAKRVAGRVESRFRKRKFLLEFSPPESEYYRVGCRFEDFEVHQMYLIPKHPNVMEAVRKRGQYGSYTYTHIIRSDKNIETRYNLTGRQYVSLLARRDTSRLPIHQTRRYFHHADRLYHVDCFLSPSAIRSVVFLQTYVSTDREPDAGPLVPDWITSCVQDVTDDPRYSMYHYSLASHGVTKLLEGIKLPASRFLHQPAQDSSFSGDDVNPDDDDDVSFRVRLHRQHEDDEDAGHS